MIAISCLERESIVIDNCITVTVVEINGDHIVLEINAPDDMPVLAAEQLEELTSLCQG